MTRGRPVDGGKRVGRCDGSEDAKLRAETVVAYLARTLTAEEACARLKIGESRFHEVVQASIQGMVKANELGQSGRPRERSEEDEKIVALEGKVGELEHELKLAKLLENLRWVPHHRMPPKKT